MALLTLKSVHLALRVLNHIHTSYSYHISLTFDLHNCISTKTGRKHYYLLWFTLTLSKKGSKTLKRVQNPKKEKGTENHRKIPWVTTLGQKTLDPFYKNIMKGSLKLPFSHFHFVSTLGHLFVPVIHTPFCHHPVSIPFPLSTSRHSLYPLGKLACGE